MKLKYKMWIILWCLVGINLCLLAAYFTDGNQATEGRPLFERIKALQRQVGCVKIDGEIGGETKLMINRAVEKEKLAAEKELFNSYANECFTESGGPE